MIRKHDIVPGEILELMLEGSCGVDEIVAAIEAYYHPGLKGVLWNVSDADLKLDAEGMKSVASAGRHRATHHKTAHYSSRDLQFGLLRMYEAYAEVEEVAPSMMAFRDRDEAIAWLKAP